MEQNPVEQAIEYLEECGWTDEEARNLLSALYHEDQEKFLDSLPEWIKHVGEAKAYMAMLETISMGFVDVTRTENDWLFSLNDKGKQVGEQLQ